MARRAALPADVARHAVGFARAMTLALRSWGFYPPEHPAVALAVDRLVAAASLSPQLANAPTAIVGFLEDDVVVNDFCATCAIARSRRSPSRAGSRSPTSAR